MFDASEESFSFSHKITFSYISQFRASCRGRQQPEFWNSSTEESSSVENNFLSRKKFPSKLWTLGFKEVQYCSKLEREHNSPSLLWNHLASVHYGLTFENHKLMAGKSVFLPRSATASIKERQKSLLLRPQTQSLCSIAEHFPKELLFMTTAVEGKFPRVIIYENWKHFGEFKSFTLLETFRSLLGLHLRLLLVIDESKNTVIHSSNLIPGIASVQLYLQADEVCRLPVALQDRTSHEAFTNRFQHKGFQRTSVSGRVLWSYRVLCFPSAYFSLS